MIRIKYHFLSSFLILAPYFYRNEILSVVLNTRHLAPRQILAVFLQNFELLLFLNNGVKRSWQSYSLDYFLTNEGGILYLLLARADCFFGLPNLSFAVKLGNLCALSYTIGDLGSSLDRFHPILLVIIIDSEIY